MASSSALSGFWPRREQRAQQTKSEGSPYALAREALALAIAERKEECASGLGKNCQKLRDLEDRRRAALAAHQVPKSYTLVADATGLPAWVVEITPALAFSTGLLMLGLVLVGFGGHSMKVEAPAVPEAKPDEAEQVVSWVREFRRRRGRDPKIPEVQQAFKLAKTTAWRRIQSS